MTTIECAGCLDQVPVKDCIVHEGDRYCTECQVCRDCGGRIEPGRLGLTQCRECKERDDEQDIPHDNLGCAVDADPPQAWEPGQ